MKLTTIYLCKHSYIHGHPCCETMCTECYDFLSLRGIHSYDKPTDDEIAAQKAVPKKKRSTHRQSMRNGSNKVPEYKADRNGCQHDNPKLYEKEEQLNHYLGESKRAARARKGEKNVSLVCMDCKAHHITGVVIVPSHWGGPISI